MKNKSINLSLNKLTISKLDNLRSIKGGHFPIVVRDNTTGTFASPAEEDEIDLDSEEPIILFGS